MNVASQIVKKIQQRNYYNHYKLSIVQLETLLRDLPDLSIILPNWAVDLRAGNLFDGFVIAALAKVKQPAIYFEIGTGHGRSALFVSANTPEHTVIYSLDPQHSINSDVGSVYRNYPESQKINELKGDSVLFDFSSYKNKVDFVFVDGSHAYQNVLKDTATTFELVAPRGWIVWHDVSYAHKDVMMALKDSGKSNLINQIANTAYAIYQND